MPTFESSPEYEHGLPESLGVLLVNLGTPDEPTTSSVRRYLAEFLSDPRVVEAPRAIWWLILHGYILRFRPSRSAAAYREIWTEQGSPLLLHSQVLADSVQQILSGRLNGSVNVELAMTYGNPSIPSALQKLHDAGARRIIVLPLYPQYSGSTTAAVFDAVTDALQKRRWVPELRFVNHYHDAPGYVAAVAASIREYWEQNGEGDHLLFSFHGVPEKMLYDGDPYHCHCHKTARMVADALDLAPESWTLSFQSRVGRAQWLRPYTDKTVRQLAKKKIGKLDVVCPGFAVDCLETLEEIEIQNAEAFAKVRGGDLRYIPALNAREDHVAFMSRLIERTAGGWPETSSDWSVSETARQLEKSRERAQAKGAKR